MFPFRDHNPSGKTPFVTYALIVLNCLIFFGYWGDLSNYRVMSEIYANWALIPARLGDGEGYETLLSSAFLHGGIWHLGGNMLFLHIYGDNLEDEMGHVKFLGFYLLCAISAGLVQVMSAPYSDIPVVGASGAVAGVMGGYLLLYPKAKVDVLFIFIIFFRIFSLPAWIILSIWFALQFFNGVSTPSDIGGVAYWAHIGGFLAGIALCLPLLKRLGGSSFWSKNLGLPPHPEAYYRIQTSNIPKIRRRRK
ncbi:MAG: rhomboid family intramembrane serine protease [Paracoccaceae bacterium]